ncbi:unnamed protein product, partial [Meganyctiphanes norvegica]
MSESFVRQECEGKFTKGTILYNSKYENNDVEVKHNNDNRIRLDESDKLQVSLRKSTYGIFEVKVETEIEVNKELMNIPHFDMKQKEGMEMYEEPKEGMVTYVEPITFTGKSYFAKHALTESVEKFYQCSYCNITFSQNKEFLIHLRTHTVEKP